MVVFSRSLAISCSPHHVCKELITLTHQQPVSTKTMHITCPVPPTKPLTSFTHTIDSIYISMLTHRHTEKLMYVFTRSAPQNCVFVYVNGLFYFRDAVVCREWTWRSVCWYVAQVVLCEACPYVRVHEFLLLTAAAKSVHC